MGKVIQGFIKDEEAAILVKDVIALLETQSTSSVINALNVLKQKAKNFAVKDDSTQMDELFKSIFGLPGNNEAEMDELRKALKAKEKDFKKSLDDIVSGVDSFFKAFITPIEQPENTGLEVKVKPEVKKESKAETKKPKPKTKTKKTEK